MIIVKVFCKMSENKRVLNYPIESSNQLIEIVEGLTEINVDMDVDSTPSSIEIVLHGSEDDIRNAVNKVENLVEKSKSS